MYYFVASLIIVVLIIIIYSVIIGRNKKQLKKCDIKDFSCHLKKVSARQVSDKEKIIDYDKIYHKILLKSGYFGSFGDILKKEPKEIKNLNKIWELHKVRNLLVHEIGYPKGVDLEATSSDYKKEISKLLQAFGK